MVCLRVIIPASHPIQFKNYSISRKKQIGIIFANGRMLEEKTHKRCI
jgi:hypothetical protein